MEEKKFTIPDSVSEETKAWAKKEDSQLIGVVCRGSAEFPIVICKHCDCPRFADYPCDTCEKRAMKANYKEFKQEIDRFKIFLKQY